MNCTLENERLNYLLLSQKQGEFLGTQLKRLNFLIGTTGSGKSWIANWFFYNYITILGSGKKFLLTGNTLDTLNRNVIIELKKIDLSSKKLSFRQTSPQILAENGAMVFCVGVNNDGSQAKLTGGSIDGIWYADEPQTYPEESFNMALSRLRGPGPNGKDVPSPMMATLNPAGPMHYIKRRFVDKPAPDVKLWHFGFDDNPSISDELRKAYEESYSGVFYQRMILGQWANAEGLVYNEFNQDRNIVTQAPERYREMLVGADWGYNHPMALILIGVDYDQNYWVIDEIYKSGQLVDNSLLDIIKTKGWLKLPITAYADTESPSDIIRLRDLTGWTILGAAKPAGSVLDGIKIVQGLLKPSGNGKPRMYVRAETCPNVIREFSSYSWRNRKGNTDEHDEPEKINDHAMDALRYPIYSLEIGRARMVKSSPFRK
jgi:phage terminase large subunit